MSNSNVNSKNGNLAPSEDLVEVIYTEGLSLRNRVMDTNRYTPLDNRQREQTLYERVAPHVVGSNHNLKQFYVELRQNPYGEDVHIDVFLFFRSGFKQRQMMVVSETFEYEEDVWQFLTALTQADAIMNNRITAPTYEPQHIVSEWDDVKPASIYAPNCICCHENPSDWEGLLNGARVSMCIPCIDTTGEVYC